MDTRYKTRERCRFVWLDLFYHAVCDEFSPKNRDSSPPPATPKWEKSWFSAFVELHVTAEWEPITEGTSPDNQQFDMHSIVSMRSQRRSVLGAQVIWRQCPAVSFWFFFSKKNFPIQGNEHSAFCLKMFLFLSRSSTIMDHTCWEADEHRGASRVKEQIS